MSVRNSLDFVIQWHLTERCNLRCTHCYQTGAGTDELSFSEIENALQEITEMFDIWTANYGLSFSPSFNITGGEPFLRNDLFDILGEIKKHGYELYLLTNGTLIDESRARALGAIGVDGVQVSLEGPADVHETIRGRGSFAASLSGIRHLREADIPVTVNTTLSRINAPHFSELARIASQAGVQRLGYSRLVPSGRGAGLVDRMLSKEKVRELYGQITSLSLSGLALVTGDPVASQMKLSAPGEDTAEAVAVGGCAAGVSGLTFLPDGTIVPCRRLQMPIGNLRRDSLREIWATSPVLEALRDKSRYSGKCGTCSRWADCRGCRAIAYAFSLTQGRENLLAEDPQCFLDE